MLNKLLVPAQTQDSIRFVVSPTGTRVVTLQDFTAPYAAVVDWGDGAQDAIVADTPVSHTYADSTPREVRITGALGGFWNATTRPGGTTMVTALQEISSQSLVSLNETFRQCTSLTTVPAVITAPNLTSCVRTFYQCKSITSDFPALWLTHAQATHTSAFTQSFLSMYGHYGTSCPNRQYVAAVAKQTYYDKYGTGCSAATYHAATAAVSMYIHFQNLGYSLSEINSMCPRKGSWEPHDMEPGHSHYTAQSGMPLPTYKCSYVYRGSGPSSNFPDGWSWGCSVTGIYYGCNRQCHYNYSNAQPAYYSCGQSSLSGTTTCDSTCARVYQSGQSAYYKCKKSNSTCQTNSCPYAYANQASVDAARAAGWL